MILSTLNLNNLKTLKTLIEAFLAAETRIAIIIESIDILLIKCVRANNIR